MNFFTFFKTYIQPKLIDNKFTYNDIWFKFYLDNEGTIEINGTFDIDKIRSFYSHSNINYNDYIDTNAHYYVSDNIKDFLGTNENFKFWKSYYQDIVRNEKINEFLL